MFATLRNRNFTLLWSGQFVSLIGDYTLAVMFVVYIKRVLLGNGLVFGLMPIAQGVGALLGSFLIGRAHKVIRPGYLIASCLVVIGAATFVFVHIPALLLVLIMIALISICIVGSYVTKQTLLQLNTLNSYRGRVFGAIGTTDSLTLLVGMLIATLFGDRLGAVTFLDWAGILYIISGLVACIMLRNAKMISEQGL